MKKNRGLIHTLGFAFAVLLTGCGGTDSATNPPSATAVTHGPADVVCPHSEVHVAVRKISLPVANETATGLLYEPYYCTPGDIQAQHLIVFAHGHGETAESFANVLGSLARDTVSPIITMNHGSPGSQWTPGEWNVWIGWQETVAATQWYRGRHPAIRKIILWGWSQGGTTSGLALAYGPDNLYDWWVASFPIANAFVAWAGTAIVDPDFRAEIEHDAGNCNPVACPLAYAARSPELLALQGMITPKHAVILHGLYDTTVPYEESLRLKAALITSGVPVSFYTVVTGYDSDGNIVPAGHGSGPVGDEAADVVRRIVAGTEPTPTILAEYLIDAANNINTAPKP